MRQEMNFKVDNIRIQYKSEWVSPHDTWVDWNTISARLISLGKYGDEEKLSLDEEVERVNESKREI